MKPDKQISFSAMPKGMADEIKKMTFQLGHGCECGEKLTQANIKTKTKCESKEALENHIIYPTFSLLDDIQQLTQHWVLLVEINAVHSDQSDFPDFITGFTATSEFGIVAVNQLYFFEEECLFDWEELKEGYTLAILYAQKNKKDGEPYFSKKS